MNKVAVITGAAGGIGKELTTLYRKKNYSLILADKDGSGFSELKTKEGVEVVIGDITKSETRKRIVDFVTQKYKKLDILINNAGITFIQPFEDNTEEQLNRIVDTNLKAPILLTHELYGFMKLQGEGVIIFTNSSAGKQGYPNHTLYSTTKFGLSGFAQSLRHEARKFNIRILSVHPGGIKTPFYDHAKEKPDTSGYMDARKVAEIIVYLSETSDLSPDEIVINRLSK